MTEPIHIISLGAGVQSSTMALMAAHGEITPMPKCAIFADTQGEPQSVYKWLDWLEKQLPFPVHRVTAGSLSHSALQVRKRKDGAHDYIRGTIPVFLINQDGSLGTRPRQCTKDFKVTPLVREAKRVMRELGATGVVQWIGISLDEAHRMKSSKNRKIEHRWPLIESRTRRGDCINWMTSRGFPKPPRSACLFCPYHSDTEWRRLRDEEPNEFQKAVAFEKAYQASDKSVKQRKPIHLFLHPSRIPLDQVDFSTDEDHGQQVMFGNECEGMCGV